MTSVTVQQSAKHSSSVCNISVCRLYHRSLFFLSVCLFLIVFQGRNGTTMKFLQMPKLAELTTFLSKLEIGDQILDGVVEAYSCKATGSEKKMAKQLNQEYSSMSTIEENSSGETSSATDTNRKRAGDAAFGKGTRASGHEAGAENDPALLAPPSSLRSRSVSFSQCGAYSIPGEEFATKGANPTPLGSMVDPAVRSRIVQLIGTMNATFHDYDFTGTKPDRFVRHLSYKDVMPIINKNFAEIVEIHRNGFLKILWDALDDAVKVRECEVFSYLLDDDDPPAVAGNLWSLNYFFYNKKMNRILYLTCVANSKFGQKDSQGYDEFDDYEQFSSDEEMTTSDVDRSQTPGTFYTGEEADADSMEY